MLNYVQHLIRDLLTKRIMNYKITNPVEYESMHPESRISNGYRNSVDILGFSTDDYIVRFKFFQDGNTSIAIYFKKLDRTSIYHYYQIQRYSVYFQPYQQHFDEDEKILKLLEDAFKLKLVSIDGKQFFELKR